MDRYVSVSQLAQALRRTQVMAGRLLLVIADEDTSDRFAQALAQIGGYAFMFASELGMPLRLRKRRNRTLQSLRRRRIAASRSAKH